MVAFRENEILTLSFQRQPFAQSNEVQQPHLCTRSSGNGLL